MKKRTIREKLARGTPSVGENHEWSNCVRLQIQKNRVSITIIFQNGVIGIVTAMMWREFFPGRTDVGAVKEDDGVEMGNGGVHGGDSCIGDKEFPRAGEIGTCGNGDEMDKEGKEEE